MNWILDIILLAIVVVIIVINTKKGCTSLIKLVTPIVALALAYFLGPKIGELLFGEFMLENTTDTITALLAKTLENSSEFNASDMVANLPAVLRPFVEMAGIEVEELAALFAYGDLINVEVLAAKLAPPVANCIASALGCVVVFVAGWLLMLLVTFILSLLFKLPVLKQANQIVGFVLGLINSFALLWAVCILLGLAIEYSLLGSYNEVLAGMVQNSYVYRFFCNLSLVDFINTMPIK